MDMAKLIGRVKLKCNGTRCRTGREVKGKLANGEWVASTLHTISERGISSITTADAHTLAVSSRLDWRPRRFKWIRPFRLKTKSGFCVCAITFQLTSTNYYESLRQPQGHSALEGLCQWKILMIPSGVKPATFRLTALCLVQMRHRVPRNTYQPCLKTTDWF